MIVTLAVSEFLPARNAFNVASGCVSETDERLMNCKVDGEVTLIIVVFVMRNSESVAVLLAAHIYVPGTITPFKSNSPAMTNGVPGSPAAPYVTIYEPSSVIEMVSGANNETPEPKS